MSVSYFIPDLAPEDLHRCEEIVRRSRFIVSLAHTPTPEAAKSFIELSLRRPNRHLGGWMQ